MAAHPPFLWVAHGDDALPGVDEHIRDPRAGVAQALDRDRRFLGGEEIATERRES